jgi:hypothetical protein
VSPQRIANPYVTAAQDWLDAGWFPFPARHTEEKSKAPCVPKWFVEGEKHSVIGHDVYDADYALHLEEWKARYPRAELGIRLPRSVLGIDVDMYDGKGGRERLRDLVATYGPLEPTWVSTSRSDGSGIYLYGVEDSRNFPNDLGHGIELIRACSRFMLASPSTHPKTGNRYGFLRPDSVFVLDEFPAVTDVTPLRESWAVGLAQEVRQRRSVIVQAGDVRSWIEALPGGRGEACEAMRNTFNKYSQELASAGDGSRHDAALRGVHALVGDATEGHVGLYRVLVWLGKQLEAKRAGEGDPIGEFKRMVHTEVERRMASPIRSQDLCEWNLG